MVKTYRKPITLVEDVVAADLDTKAIALIQLGATKVDGDSTGFANDGTLYKFSVDIDGGGTQSISMLGSASQIMSELLTEINADLTGITATHVSGESFITLEYDTEGAHDLEITDGSGEALIATLFGGGASIGIPVDGVEGTITFEVVSEFPEAGTDDFVFVMTVYDTNGLVKAGLIANYSTTTGVLTVTDNGVTTELADGDKIVIVGTFI